MVERENDNSDALPATASEKEFLIFQKYGLPFRGVGLLKMSIN